MAGGYSGRYAGWTGWTGGGGGGHHNPWANGSRWEEGISPPDSEEDEPMPTSTRPDVFGSLTLGERRAVENFRSEEEVLRRIGVARVGPATVALAGGVKAFSGAAYRLRDDTPGISRAFWAMREGTTGHCC